MTVLRVCGLMSGTSVDGIDVAIVDFALGPGAVLSARIVAVADVAYEPGLRERLLAVIAGPGAAAEEFVRLHADVGASFGAAAAIVIAGLGDGRPAVVASHGQTVHHAVAPDGRVLGTWQLGDPARIAARCGAPVVADLRAADIAMGGQGAPLAPMLDLLLLASLPGHPVAVNLGGIANISVPGRDGRPTLGYDTGPANALIDEVVQRRTGRAFDRDGALAAGGTVDPDLLAAMLAQQYFARRPPKSTGKELFGPDWLEQFPRAGDLADADLVATLTELTATTVAEAVRHAGADRLLCSGGGWRNLHLRTRLAALLPNVRVGGFAEIGVDEDAKEALLVALIGWLTVHGLPANLPSVTGAERAVVLGSVTDPQGRGVAGLEPHPVMPSALVVEAA